MKNFSKMAMDLLTQLIGLSGLKDEVHRRQIPKRRLLNARPAHVEDRNLVALKSGWLM